MRTNELKFTIPRPIGNAWTRSELMNLKPRQKRHALVRDFSDIFFRRPDNNHVGLIGTRFNFYTKYWLFGYPHKCGEYTEGQAIWTMVYISLEDLLDEDIPEQVKTRLLFYLDILTA